MARHAGVSRSTVARIWYARGLKPHRVDTFKVSTDPALKLLTDRRDELVDQRSAAISRLLWRVHELDPAHAPKPRALSFSMHREPLAAWLGTQAGLVAELARTELVEVARLSEEIKVLTRRITARVSVVAPDLLAIPGCGPLSAAKIIGETAGVGRFRNEAAFACHAGVAPLPRWSGRTAGRMRRARYGNRQLNTALYWIALIQIRDDTPGRAYYQRRIAAGDKPSKALRALKRRLARVVFNRLQSRMTSRTASG